MSKYIHLDVVGGIAGDMFVAAMLDCLPVTLEQVTEQIHRAGFGDLVTLRAETHNDGVLRGTRFSVQSMENKNTDGGHTHRHYAEIHDKLSHSELDEGVKTHAVGIFHCLAEAESRVHGTSIDRVAFHEVGAWDSIADIVASAYLIEASGARYWSVSSLPAGNGLVDTAHGKLPLPAPAVALLLENFRFHNDGLEGERVTPTGAAILRYLEAGAPAHGAKVLQASGFGFGSRSLAGISNVLRIMVYDDTDAGQSWLEDEVLELGFEVDDQRPEDLALALDKLRLHPGVLDVSVTPVHGKRGRIAGSVRLLAEPRVSDEVIALCFNETSTLGIRREQRKRSILRRMEITVSIDGRDYRAKLVQRPNGELTVKAEQEDLAQTELGHADRELLRQEVESLAVDALLEQQDDMQ